MDKMAKGKDQQVMVILTFRWLKGLDKVEWNPLTTVKMEPFIPHRKSKIAKRAEKSLLNPINSNTNSTNKKVETM